MTTTLIASGVLLLGLGYAIGHVVGTRKLKKHLAGAKEEIERAKDN
jgi:hypothetical protein